MIYSYLAPTLACELGKLKELIAKNKLSGKKTVIFCEDRLTLVAERAVCEAVGGTFDTAVYTFARFLANESKSARAVISSQGSAMAIRAIIDRSGQGNMSLFKKFSSAASAAQSIYDTIAILYASGVDIEQLENVQGIPPILAAKLHDICFIYRHYRQFLEDSGKTDRNVYLQLLPGVIEKSKKTSGADIILLGFQAFTGTTKQCVQACMKAGANVYGLFTGGSEDIYTNEAYATFNACARDYVKSDAGFIKEKITGSLCEQAELIRTNLFNPQSTACAAQPDNHVFIFEGADEEQELEFIAANIKKHAAQGVRYAEISVMLPSADYARGTLARVFASYHIPYYVDERRSLENHPLTQFICSYIDCVAGNCAPEDVCAVTGSFLFGCTQKERDIFRNYVARCAFFRGGVKREPSADACEACNFDYDAVVKMQKRFTGGLACLPKGKASVFEWAQGIAQLMEFFGCRQVIEGVAADCRDKYPAQSQYYARAYNLVISVINEAQDIVPEERYDPRQYKKLIKSGFVAAEISLIPPKTDAVFVGDISSTVNAGSKIVFACGLTDAVPPAGADTALLTDREISSLEKLDLQITPKIAEVNRRARETVALNLCAFSRMLYITYPVLAGGKEQEKSEIIGYISRLFNIKAQNFESLLASYRNGTAAVVGVEDYCSEQAPALNWLASGRLNSGMRSSLYECISDKAAAEGAIAEPAEKTSVACADKLFSGNGTVSPSLLEKYFSCPYQNFLERGLRLEDRKQGDNNPADTGNFIHEVLQQYFRQNTVNYNLQTDAEKAEEDVKIRARAKALAEELLKEKRYSVLGESESGKYMLEKILEEAQDEVSGACEQLVAGNFRVFSLEKWYEMPLDGGITVKGKVDRVDKTDEGMIRIIDYKSGGITFGVVPYYVGEKLQLPLYLSAVTEDVCKNTQPEARAVGTYYFPANTEYVEQKKGGGVFRLAGYMDYSDDVVAASDSKLEGASTSLYSPAKYGANNHQPDTSMPQQQFSDFIAYSRLIAQQGAEEIFGGYVKPSPYGDACKYCSYGGICGFSKELADPREVKGVKAQQVAEIAAGGADDEENTAEEGGQADGSN